MNNRLNLHKYTKVASVICALAIFAQFCAAAQSAAVSDNGAAVSVSGETAAAQAQNDAAVFDETMPFNTVPAAESTRRSVLGTAGVFLRMILVLLFVIAMIYGFVWFMKKSVVRGNNSDQFLRVVSSVTLAPGKSVQIVSLLDEKAYMLGVSDNSVNVIAEIENRETINAMNLYADKMSAANKPRNFEDILNIFMPGGAKGKAKGAALDGDEAAALLRRTREAFAGEDTEGKTEADE